MGPRSPYSLHSGDGIGNGSDAAGDALLRDAERWLACNEEISRLFGMPLPPAIEEMREVLTAYESLRVTGPDLTREGLSSSAERRSADLRMKHSAAGSPPRPPQAP